MLSQLFKKLKISPVIFSIRFILVGIVLILINSSAFVSAEKNISQLNYLRLITPQDIKVTIFAKDVSRARHMAFDDQGVLFLSQSKEGKVVALPDFDKNGKQIKRFQLFQVIGLHMVWRL